jgi:hypothetical protein
MVDSRDRSALRTLVDEVVGGLGSLTHRELNPAFEQLGMPPVPDDAGSKRERIELSLSQVHDTELPQVTRRLLEQGYVHVSPSRRYRLEHLLWEEDAPPEIPKKARRELARALDLSELAQHYDRFMRLLERFWIAEDSGLSFGGLEGLLLSGMRPVRLRDRIERYVFRNPGDWSTEDLLDNLGVFEAGDGRFARFLEGLVSADVLLDEHLQEKTVSTINGHLRAAGVELRVTGNDGGYPVFTLVSTRLPGNRRPKNIIQQRPVDLVRRDVHELADAVPHCRIRKNLGAEHVRRQEGAGSGERAVDVRFGGEVDDRRVLPQEGVDQVGVEDVAVDERQLRTEEHFAEVLSVPRVRECVEHRHMANVVGPQDALDEVRADEPGPTRDKQFVHGRTDHRVLLTYGG